MLLTNFKLFLVLTVNFKCLIDCSLVSNKLNLLQKHIFVLIVGKCIRGKQVFNDT